eukprot:72754_1
MGSSFCSCSTPSKNNENMLLQEAKTTQHNSPRQNNDGKQNKKAPNPSQMHATKHCMQSQSMSTRATKKLYDDMDLTIFGCVDGQKKLYDDMDLTQQCDQ